MQTLFGFPQFLQLCPLSVPSEIFFFISTVYKKQKRKTTKEIRTKKPPKVKNKKKPKKVKQEKMKERRKKKRKVYERLCLSYTFGLKIKLRVKLHKFRAD